VQSRSKSGLARTLLKALAIVACLIVSESACAQNVPPADKAGKQEVTEVRTTETIPILKAKVHLVLLDVVVTKGLHNEPVTGLQQREFSVFEDGKRQRILSFAAHTNELAESAPAGSPIAALPPDTFLDIAKPEDALTPNVLLYDELNTPLVDRPFALQQVISYLQNKPAGARFAIFVLTDKLHLVQGFTNDNNLLAESLRRESRSTYLGLVVQDDQERTSPLDLLTRQLRGFGMGSFDALRDVESTEAAYLARRRLEAIVEAFYRISQFLGGAPGRKNLIWLSGTFPSGILPGNAPSDFFANSTFYSSELRKVTTQLVLSQIAVYPVDARGLMLAQPANAITMDEIADASGGRAFYNTNGLKEAISAAVKQGTHYYTLSYSPSDKNFSGRMRKIRVALAPKGFHLAYRHSYFDGGLIQKGKGNAGPRMDRLEAVMERGAPAVHEILYKVQVTPVGTPSHPSEFMLTEMKKLGALAYERDSNGMKSQHYMLRFAILGKQLTILAAGHSTFALKAELAAQTYDQDNRLLTGDAWIAEQQLSKEEAAGIQRDACRLSREIEVPERAAWLRIAVRDLFSGDMGTLEIPLPLSANGKGTGR
jgi:VWFA-related protein